MCERSMNQPFYCSFQDKFYFFYTALSGLNSFSLTCLHWALSQVGLKQKWLEALFYREDYLPPRQTNSQQPERAIKWKWKF